MTATLLKASADAERWAIRLDVTLPEGYAMCTVERQFEQLGETGWTPVPGLTYIQADERDVTILDYRAPLSTRSVYRVLAFRQDGDRWFAAEDYSDTAYATLRY